MDPNTVHTRRITGLETEFGITSVLDSHRRLGPDEVARYLFAPVVEKHRSSNIYWSNASRVYLDVGAHPEFATAECDSLHQLVTYDRAGELIFHRLASRCEETLAERGIGGKVYLLKNNTDSVGNSYGCHENYLVGRELPLKALSTQLLPFLVTRQLICGAGKISVPTAGAPNENFGPGFCLSQRSDHVWEGVSSATTRSRPIINTRDEPHADSSRFRRLHVIVGDSNMSETTTALKVGSALLVLEMIEAGVNLPDFELSNEIRSIREIARDLTGSTPLDLRNGTSATALAIQRAFHAAAVDWLAQREEDSTGTPNSQLAAVVELWGRVLDCVETGDFSPVDTEIDWVIKKKLLDAVAARGNLAITDPRLAQIDLTYHDINPDRGLFHMLVRRGAAKTLIDPAAVDLATRQSPQTTRAAVRGRFLTASEASSRQTTVDWSRLKVNGEGGGEILLPDPFCAGSPEIDAALADLTGLLAETPL
ncbi:Pup--protein ligase [Corynebacterium terpenotabidum]|uniref:Pup--protein ligase n=1 Tax=Corynebacterium terpenotabidum Y-11 TaxID=1200352 RepID=S4XDX2_9CORY|nr:Pup--protein ligase [Corynebacterium terpenotabidum]AGP30751.1 proteasome accessory factor [Corynebacterium terpenotabidum Y-11]